MSNTLTHLDFTTRPVVSRLPGHPSNYQLPFGVIVPLLGVCRECSFRLSARKEKMIWQALSQCGLKQQLTWDDALMEAKSIADAVSCDRAVLLFRHLEDNYQKFVERAKASKALALEMLQRIAWVPACMPQEPSLRESGERPECKLQKLENLYPKTEQDLVWAVAPTLHRDLPDPKLLQAGKTVRSQPQTLILQLRKLASVCPHKRSRLRSTLFFSEAFAMQAWFSWAQSRGSQECCFKVWLSSTCWHGLLFRDTVPTPTGGSTVALETHRETYEAHLRAQGWERLADGVHGRRLLAMSGFRLRFMRVAVRSALHCFPDHAKRGSVSPAVGIVHPAESIQLLAKKLEVPTTPDAHVLVQLIKSSSTEKAVVLCEELAKGLSASEVESCCPQRTFSLTMPHGRAANV